MQSANEVCLSVCLSVSQISICPHLAAPSPPQAPGEKQPLIAWHHRLRQGDGGRGACGDICSTHGACGNQSPPGEENKTKAKEKHGVCVRVYLRAYLPLFLPRLLAFKVPQDCCSSGLVSLLASLPSSFLGYCRSTPPLSPTGSNIHSLPASLS